MKILVLGATGRTGQRVIMEAIRRGHQVSAIARDPEKLAGLDVDVARLDVTQGTPYNYETVEKAMAGCDAVINTLNVSRKSDNPWASLRSPVDLISKAASHALDAMPKQGIKRFVALSTLGAGRSWSNAPWILRLIVSISNLKHAFRDHGRQEELLENSSADYTICRAPMLSDKDSPSGVVATPEGEKPASTVLQRTGAAVFFLDIIENNLHVREIVSLANGPRTS